jgi:hypothetical protein
MRNRYVAIAVGLLGVVLLVVPPAAGQSAADGWVMPRTADGQPELQGAWSFANLTPLERPDELAGRELLTDEEVAARNADASTRASSDRRGELTRERDVGLAYNQFWWDRGTSDGRTSLIVDPADGRVPYTPAGRERAAALRQFRGRPAHGPEDRGLQERCIQYRPLPRLPTGYNNHYQIVQTPNHVAILVEMIHAVRIIPLDGRPHVDDGVRLWNGDSRGRWEGDTLVVETTNFSDKTNFSGSGANLHLVERFRRVDADTVEYEFTVKDPGVWERPWTGMLPFTKTEEPIFEYACHEGNYGMTNLLVGARFEDRAIEESKTQSR